MKIINIKGVDYPLQFNMLVFAEWEKLTSKNLGFLSEMQANANFIEEYKVNPLPENKEKAEQLTNNAISDAVALITLLYCAIKDACEETNTPFNITLSSYIRSIPITDIGIIANYISDGIETVESTESEGK